MHRPISKWWPIGLAIGAVALYAIGGGLVGSACDYYYCDLSLWNAGVAFCSLAAICSVAWLVMLVLWATRRNRTTPYNAQTVVLDSRNVPVQPVQMQSQQAHAEMEAEDKAQPVVQAQAVNGDGQGGRFCGQCGTQASTPFCSKCGTRV